MTKKEKETLARHIRINKDIMDDNHNIDPDGADYKSAVKYYAESTLIWYLLTGEHWNESEKSRS